MRLRASRRATRHTATRALVNDAHRREMTYFEALGEALRDLLEPAAVGATKVTTKGPKNSALADADVTVDVNGAARAIAVDAKQTFELPIDGVKLVAKANHHGDLSADVVASGLALSGLDVAVEGLARTPRTRRSGRSSRSIPSGSRLIRRWGAVISSRARATRSMITPRSGPRRRCRPRAGVWRTGRSRPSDEMDRRL